MAIKHFFQRQRLKQRANSLHFCSRHTLIEAETKCEIEGENASSDRFYFLGLKVTADSDCSHEIKKRLLLGKKAMTNLDNVLKDRDITLQPKIHPVKTTVFPVVMYGCKSWIIKMAEH